MRSAIVQVWDSLSKAPLQTKSQDICPQPAQRLKRTSPEERSKDVRRKRQSYSPQRSDSGDEVSPRHRLSSRQRERGYSPRERRRRRRRSSSPREEGEDREGERWEEAEKKEPPVKRKKEEVDPIMTRTGEKSASDSCLVWQLRVLFLPLPLLGGAYIPPARLRMMQQQMTDKSRYTLLPSLPPVPSLPPSLTCFLVNSTVLPTSACHGRHSRNPSMASSTR